MSVPPQVRPLFNSSVLQPVIDAIMNRVRRMVLVILNGKGGVGKSSLAAALAVVMIMMGKRVCLIEMDPQGNNAEDLGTIGTDLYDNGASQAKALLSGTAFVPTGEARAGLFVVPGGEILEDVVEELYIQRRLAKDTDDHSWLYMYANCIRQMQDQFDLILLDVAPGSLVLQLQAMVAGDMVLVPSRSDQSSRKGLRTVARRFIEAKPFNPSLQIIGIVLFGITSGGSKITQGIRENLTHDIRGVAPVLDTVVRYVESVAVKCRELGLVPHEVARSDDESITRSTAASAKNLAGDYRSLGMEVLTIIAQLVQKDRESA